MDRVVVDTDVEVATLHFIASRRGHLLLHSGGATAADGWTVVVHGASGAGKTTLTTALVQSGLAYVTDETVCLDPDTLIIEPFRKPLTVKPGSQELLAHLAPPTDEVSEGSGNWQLPPKRLGGPDLPDAPLHPAVIVFPDFDPDRTDVSTTTVSPARAAFVLGEQSSAMWAIEPRPLAAIARLVTTVPAFKVSYGNAFDAAPLIISDLMDAARPSGLEAPSNSPEPAPTGTAGPRRAEGVDWLLLEGEAVLFDGEHLHHLDGPGAAIWIALDGELDLPGVAAELANHYGADADSVLLDVEDLARVLSARNLIDQP
ncbi:MAG: PqqD family peptide modification chaperone [Actinomycetes bacterium]